MCYFALITYIYFGWSTSKCFVNVVGCSIQSVSGFVVVLVREWGQYLHSYYIPCGLMTVISWSSFLIKVSTKNAVSFLQSKNTQMLVFILFCFFVTWQLNMPMTIFFLHRFFMILIHRPLSKEIFQHLKRKKKQHQSYQLLTHSFPCGKWNFPMFSMTWSVIISWKGGNFNAILLLEHLMYDFGIISLKNNPLLLHFIPPCTVVVKRRLLCSALYFKEFLWLHEVFKLRQHTLNSPSCG